MKKKNDLSKRFSKWLTESKMTTEQFARSAGVSYNTVTKWRSGKSVNPRQFTKDILGLKFPACPLFK